MKKFSFSLEKVLEFRNFEKQQAENELSKCIAVENQINENLKIIAQQYAALKNQMKDSKNFDDVVSQSQFNNLLDYQKEELLKQLAQAKIVTEEKRQVLIECNKKTTALEKMRDLQYEDYKQSIKVMENKNIEELSTVKNFASFVR